MAAVRAARPLVADAAGQLTGEDAGQSLTGGSNRTALDLTIKKP